MMTTFHAPGDTVSRYRCPKCQGVIYNRRNKICGFCGAELPAELLFTAEEVATLNKEETTARERHRLTQARMDAEAAEKRARAGGFNGGFND